MVKFWNISQGIDLIKKIVRWSLLTLVIAPLLLLSFILALHSYGPFESKWTANIINAGLTKYTKGALQLRVEKASYSWDPTKASIVLKLSKIRAETKEVLSLPDVLVGFNLKALYLLKQPLVAIKIQNAFFEFAQIQNLLKASSEQTNKTAHKATILKLFRDEFSLDLGDITIHLGKELKNLLVTISDVSVTSAHDDQIEVSGSIIIDENLIKLQGVVSLDKPKGSISLNGIDPRPILEFLELQSAVSLPNNLSLDLNYTGEKESQVHFQVRSSEDFGSQASQFSIDFIEATGDCNLANQTCKVSAQISAQRSIRTSLNCNYSYQTMSGYLRITPDSPITHDFLIKQSHLLKNQKLSDLLEKTILAGEVQQIDIAWTKADLKIHSLLTNIKARYFTNTDPLEIPELVLSYGDQTFKLIAADAKVDEVKVHGLQMIKNSGSTNLQLSFEVESELQSLIKVLLQYTDAKATPKMPSGTIKILLNSIIPLENNVSPKQVSLTALGDIHNFSFQDEAMQLNVASQNLKVKLKQWQLTADGDLEIKLGDRLLPSRIEVECDVLSPNRTVRTKLDMQKSEIVIEEIGFKKQLDAPGSILLTVQKQKPGNGFYYQIEMPDFKSNGYGEVDSEFKLIKLVAEENKLLNSDFSLNYSSLGKSIALLVHGNTLNLNNLDVDRFLGRKSKTAFFADKNIQIRADLKKLILYNGYSLSHPTIELSTEEGRVQHAGLYGNIEEGDSIKGYLNIFFDYPILAAFSNNAGGIFHALKITNDLEDGAFELKLNFDPTQAACMYPRPTSDHTTPIYSEETGFIRLRKFNIKNSFVLGTILKFANLSAFQLLKGSGIAFDNLQCSVQYVNNAIRLKRCAASGSTMYIKGNASIELDTKRTKFEGAVIPMHILNTAILTVSRFIPQFGDKLLTGSDERVNFIVEAEKGKKPKITLNPVSMVLPGFIGQFFEFGLGKSAAVLVEEENRDGPKKSVIVELQKDRIPIK